MLKPRSQLCMNILNLIAALLKKPFLRPASHYEIVTFADYYLGANIEFRNKACTRGKYYSYTKLYFVHFVFIYVYRHIYVRHVLAVALASLP